MRGISIALLIVNCSTAYGQLGLFSSEPPTEFINTQISLGGFRPDYNETTAIELITEINEGFQGACETDWSGRSNTYTMICPWEEAGYEMQIQLKWEEARDLVILSMFERTINLAFPPYEARSMLERFPTSPERQAERQAEQERKARLRGEHRDRVDALPDYRDVGDLCMNRMHESYRAQLGSLVPGTTDELQRRNHEVQWRNQELGRQYEEQRETLMRLSVLSPEFNDLSRMHGQLVRLIGTREPERFDQIEADYLFAYPEFEQAVNANSNGCRFVPDL